MNYLSIDKEELDKAGGIHTAAEIEGQPELWKATMSLVFGRQKEIQDFLKKIQNNVSKIILTGAGTSAYIGISLKGTFMRNMHVCTEAIPTTDLITHPEDFIDQNDMILLVSFARSGDSPESLAAVKTADSYSKSCHHLIITCNPEGALAGYQMVTSGYVLVLPPESNDKSLAMTGSYTSMLLSGFLIARSGKMEELIPQINHIIKYGEKIINSYVGELKKLADKNFKRAVFLGSGPLLGTATESHLKLQELTDGQVICKNESFLGFRHGPKAVVDTETIVFFILSNDQKVSKYEDDLVKSISKGKKPLAQVAICESLDAIGKGTFDLTIELSEKGLQVENELLSICYVLPAQILGFYKSLALGLAPDNPSETGAISRVVEGVKIYE